MTEYSNKDRFLMARDGSDGYVVYLHLDGADRRKVAPISLPFASPEEAREFSMYLLPADFEKSGVVQVSAKYLAGIIDGSLNTIYLGGDGGKFATPSEN